jgi:hypothetical protein
MAQSDAFALQNSGLNNFLFAEVGSEMNGSQLTMLSLLARLGKDPWTEAARLTRMPRATIVDYLTNSISQMPMCPQALTDARATAARLSLLLPSQAATLTRGVVPPDGKSRVPKWVPLAVFFAVLAAGVAYEMVASVTTPASTVMPLAGQPIGPLPSPSN